MKSVKIDSQLFTGNRDRLRQRLPRNSLVIVNSNDIMPTNADGTLGFHQNADLFYLAGIRQEESILVLAPDAFDPRQREILFLREPNPHLTIWEGHKLSRDEAQEISGIKQVQWLSDFPNVFRQLMCEAEEVFLNSNEHPRAGTPVETRDMRFVRSCQEEYPLHRYHRLARLMHELRTVKSPLEIDLIRHACNITDRGFRRVLKMIKPGINEADIEAEFAHEFIRSHGGFAYPPIIAAGANNCVLHYNANDQECRRGDLVLLDVAAGYGNYMSDLTRTVPISGRFTRRQKQVYNAVLRVMREVMRQATPGKTTRDLRELTESLITEECLKMDLLKPVQVRRQTPANPAVRQYFMHGVSHPIGLDVHDVMYNHFPIQPGWVLTCEPGIYIAQEGFGIRIENTFVVKENGFEDLMANIPIEAEEIESIMAK